MTDTAQAPLPAHASRFEPKVVAFLCHWCSYAGADKAGAAQLACPANVGVIRTMCGGRLDPQLVLEAFRKGADGVVALGCHPESCHYKEGSAQATARHVLLAGMLEQFGIPKARFRFDYVSASEAEKYARLLNQMVQEVRALGPLNWQGARAD